MLLLTLSHDTSNGSGKSSVKSPPIESKSELSACQGTAAHHTTVATDQAIALVQPHHGSTLQRARRVIRLQQSVGNARAGQMLLTPALDVAGTAGAETAGTQAIVAGTEEKASLGWLRATFLAAARSVGVDGTELLGNLERTGASLGLILRHPIRFVGHLVQAVGQGFRGFVGNFAQHAGRSLLGWLFGQVASTGINLPERLSAAGVFDVVRQVVGLTYDRLRERATRIVGEDRIEKLEQVFDVLGALFTGGPMALWGQFQAYLGGLWSRVTEEVSSWLVTRVIRSALAKVMRILVPGGGLLQAILSSHRSLKFFLEKARHIAEIGQTVLGSMAKIARGATGAAAGAIEAAMAGTLPLVVDFAARFLGLSGLGQRVRKVIEKLRNPVDKAADRVIHKVVAAIPEGGKTKPRRGRSPADEVKSEEAPAETIEEPHFRQLMRQTTFLSIADIAQMGKTHQEFIARRHKRKSNRRVGAIGQSLMSKIQPGLAGEYDRKREEAEQEEVGEYKRALSNKDSWEIYAVIERTRNRDELKAALLQLAKKGRLDFHDRRLWAALSRLGSSVRFYEKDAADSTALAMKMQRALTAMFGPGLYRSLSASNQASFEFGKEQYRRETDENLPVLNPSVSSMLQEHMAGKAVDPHRYEAYVNRLIELGKGSPQEAFYFILMGVSEGLLSPDRIAYFNSTFLNELPALEFFTWKAPDMSELRRLGSTFATSTGQAPAEFQEWFTSQVLTHKAVKERTLKSALWRSQQPPRGHWDHDYARMIASIGSSSTAKTLAGTETTGKPRGSATSYANVVTGSRRPRRRSGCR